jgi:hypothetical protein
MEAFKYVRLISPFGSFVAQVICENLYHINLDFILICYQLKTWAKCKLNLSVP